MERDTGRRSCTGVIWKLFIRNEKMKLLIVEDDCALNDGIALSLKADADAF